MMDPSEGNYITFWKTKLHFSLTKIHYSHAVSLALRSWFSFSNENVARIPSSVPRHSTVKFSLYDSFPRQPLSALEDHKNHLVGTAMYVYGCEQLLKDEIPPCNPSFCSFIRSISCRASHLCSFLLFLGVPSPSRPAHLPSLLWSFSPLSIFSLSLIIFFPLSAANCVPSRSFQLPT